MPVDGGRLHLVLLVLSVPFEVGCRQPGGDAVAEVWPNVLRQNLLDALRALPILPSHVSEVRVEQFVDGRLMNRRLDVRLISPKLGQLPNLEVDRFGLDSRPRGHTLACWELVPPDAPTLEQHSLTFAAASP